MTSREVPKGPAPTISADSMMPITDLKREVRTYLDTVIGYLDLLREDSKEQGHKAMSPELERIWIASIELAALVEEN